MPFAPEAGEIVCLANMVGCELQDRFSALVPEFLGSFDAAVDLLDRRLDVATGNREPGQKSSASDNSFV